MKYEICESTTVDGILSWRPIAWADSYEYAVEIARKLNANKTIHYTVMFNGVIVC